MIAPVALLISFALPVFAAHVSQWGNVQSLRPGDRVGIIQSDQKRVEGNFHNATEEGITIKTDQEITVAKTNVIRVYRRSGLSRTKRTLLGAAIGVAAGAVVAATVGARFNNEGAFGDSYSAAVVLSVAGGAGIGAAIGAPTGGDYRTIYQRTSRP